MKSPIQRYKNGLDAFAFGVVVRRNDIKDTMGRGEQGSPKEESDEMSRRCDSCDYPLFMG